MLHVLLLILKITGIVIACILGLVILIVAAVLFVPVDIRLMLIIMVSSRRMRNCHGLEY